MRDSERFTVDDPRFTTARVVGPSMLSLDGAVQRRHRDPFAPPFRAQPVRERFGAFVDEEVVRLVDGLDAAGRTELRRGLAGPLAVRTMAYALGLSATDPDRVLGLYDAIVAAVTEITAGRAPPASGREAYALLCSALEPSLDADPDASLLATVANQAGGLPRDAVLSNAAVLLFGGIETTEGMIANAFTHLLAAPGAADRARAAPEALDAVIEESLRLEPAAAVVDRYATRNVALGGARVQMRELVVVSLAGANRDPAVFDAPDRFDERRPGLARQLAFAQGPHVCVGLHLARLEARVALGRALERWPRLRLDPTHCSEVRGLVFRKPPAVHVRWD
jgi:cytochrome P450